MTALVLALVAALALAITFAAKWQETRQESVDERKEWIAKVTRLESDKQILLEGSRRDLETIRNLEQSLRTTASVAANATAGNHVLQDKLSTILCPHNNHVWVDGVCVKCGRVKDGT